MTDPLENKHRLFRNACTVSRTDRPPVLASEYNDSAGYELRGLGRAMPFTFIAFGIGALSIIGLPPLGGSWSKWSLMVGAANADQQIMIGVLMLSSLLNVAYLLPIFARGFFSPTNKPSAGSWRENIKEAPLLCVLPPSITAIGCLVLFFYAGTIVEFS